MPINSTQSIAAVIHLLLISGLGFILYRRRAITSENNDFLVKLLVYVTFPCLSFSTVVEYFRPEAYRQLGVLMTASLGLFVIGLLFGALGALLCGRLPYKREMLALVALQNCAYIPMNITLFISDEQLRNTMLLYVLLYTAGFNLWMWSIGPFYIFRKEGEPFRLSHLLSPPVWSVLLGIAIVFTGLHRFIPGVVIASVKTIGQSSFFLSLLVLGCSLAVIELPVFKNKVIICSLFLLTLLKLLVVPFAVHHVNLYLHLQNFIGYFILIEAAMPSATSLAVVGAYRNANISYLSAGIFLSTIASLVTTPVWLSLYSYYK